MIYFYGKNYETYISQKSYQFTTLFAAFRNFFWAHNIFPDKKMSRMAFIFRQIHIYDLLMVFILFIPLLPQCRNTSRPLYQLYRWQLWTTYGFKLIFVNSVVIKS